LKLGLFVVSRGDGQTLCADGMGCFDVFGSISNHHNPTGAAWAIEQGGSPFCTDPQELRAHSVIRAKAAEREVPVEAPTTQLDPSTSL